MLKNSPNIQFEGYLIQKAIRKQLKEYYNIIIYDKMDFLWQWIFMAEWLNNELDSMSYVIGQGFALVG